MTVSHILYSDGITLPYHCTTNSLISDNHFCNLGELKLDCNKI